MGLGDKIREARKKENMTQVQLACKIQKANTFVCDIERNRAVPSLKTVEKIANALNVPVGDLFS